MTYNADDFFAELRKRNFSAEYRRKNAYLSRFAVPCPLTRAFNIWPGGEPRTDWTASVGRVCWRESLRMQA